MARTGIYKLKNPHKYLGNDSSVRYKSMWERNIMNWCDNSNTIIRWSYEQIIIPYKSPITRKMHRYYPDFYVEHSTKKGIQKLVLEVKPHSQVLDPARKKRVKLHEVKTYVVNEAKWQAAIRYCKRKDLEFKIITEKNHPYLKRYNKK